MNRFTRHCATALAVVALSAPALAQSQAPSSDTTRPQPQMQDQTAPQTQGQAAPQTQDQSTLQSDAGPGFLNEQSPDQETADDLIGMTVVNSAGENVGEIEDLVFDEAQIAGAVISVGGFLGIGAKEVGVTWSSVQVEEREGKKVAVIDLTREEIEGAPTFKPYDPAPPAGTGGGMMSPGTGTTGTGGTTGRTN